MSTNHYHLFPDDSDWGCYAMIAFVILCLTVAELADKNALPWQSAPPVPAAVDRPAK